MQLILSLYPGVDVLGRGFEAMGFCVVRGPDLLWDSRIEDLHVPSHRFDGVIGGPPCQNYSDANRRRDTEAGDRGVTEFLRIVDESHPTWWVMENVRNVPTVAIAPYHIQRLDITDANCGGRQRRLRHIQFGCIHPWIIRPRRTNDARSVTPAVLCKMDSPHDRHCRRAARQGLAEHGAPSLRLRSLTPAARSRAIGNAVPWKVALELARAVTEMGPVTPHDCPCGCGRVTSRRDTQAGAACRKRMERRRRSHGRTLIYPKSLRDHDPSSVTGEPDTVTAGGPVTP